MIGAGVFAAIGPAAAAAGTGLLVGLAIAAVVAYCNATSSAELAAVYPASGGTYVYGRERLGPFWGYLAGWGFVIGKTASGAAMALVVGAYAAPSWQRPIAVLAVLGLTAVNYRGIHKTAALTRVIVVVVLAALAAVVIGSLFGGQASVDHFRGLTVGGWRGVLQSAGLLFFAFAGYARIATLGEEVERSRSHDPEGDPRALAITLVVYLLVALAALAAVGPGRPGEPRPPRSPPPCDAGNLDALTPAVRIGGTVAALGVLLSLIAGVSRTAFAMAADRELPPWLDAVHPTHRVPHRAEVAVGVLIAALVAFTDLRNAIGFSSFCVLTYYAIANAAAWTLPRGQRRWPRLIAAAGVAGCITLAFTLPLSNVLTGVAVLGVGAAIWAARHARLR